MADRPILWVEGRSGFEDPYGDAHEGLHRLGPLNYGARIAEMWLAVIPLKCCLDARGRRSYRKAGQRVSRFVVPLVER